MKGSAVQRSRVCAIATLVLLSAGSAAALPIQYVITVDTSSLSGTSGFLDFQFNPGPNTFQAAAADISNFNTGGGTLVFNASPDLTANPPQVLSPQVTGDVFGGPLPGQLTFLNGTTRPTNEIFQQFTYGSFFSFVLALSGPALSAPDGTSSSGSTFGLSLFDQNQHVILTDQASGFAGSVDVNLNGSTTVNSFPAGLSVVTFQEITDTTVPEPGSMWLLIIGTVGLVLVRKVRLQHLHS